MDGEEPGGFVSLSPTRHRRTHVALSLRPVFVESIRILKSSGVFVLQSRDIRYGGFLLNLMGIHREMCESAGLHLITQVNWESTFVMLN